jgi:hypothetical protein
MPASKAVRQKWSDYVLMRNMTIILSILFFISLQERGLEKRRYI